MFRINEAIARAKERGIKVTKGEIAAMLWPDAPEASRRVYMTKLCNGDTKRILPEQVRIICAMCGCTPNYLFGYDDK